MHWCTTREQTLRNIVCIIYIKCLVIRNITIPPKFRIFHSSKPIISESFLPLMVYTIMFGKSKKILSSIKLVLYFFVLYYFSITYLKLIRNNRFLNIKIIFLIH